MTELDLALETVVSILKTLGNHTFDTDTLDATRQKALYETWARHVLFQTAPPGANADTAEPGTEQPSERSKDPQGLMSSREALLDPKRAVQSHAGSSASQDGTALISRGQLQKYGRDWFAVRGFVEVQQTQQSDQILSDFKHLRLALTTCADSMSQLLAQEKESDALADAQLESLSSVLERGNPLEVRVAVSNTVTTIHQLLEDRQARLHAQVTRLKDQVKTLAEEVDRRDRPPELDPLTRLETRQSFDRALSHATALQQLTREPICMVLVEMDDFVKLRNYLGDPVVDRVLKRVGRCISQVFPRRGDSLARFGVDEFAILLHDASFDDGFRMAQRLLEEIRLLFIEVEGRSLGLTASIGVAALQPGEVAHRCLARADAARQKARLQGGDLLVVG